MGTIIEAVSSRADHRGRGFPLALAAMALLLFTSNEWLLKPGGNAFFTGYCNDLLGGAFLLAVPDAVTPSEPLRRFAASLTGAAVLLTLASIFFELILPRISGGPGGDPLDVIAYFSGGIIYLVSRGVARRG